MIYNISSEVRKSLIEKYKPRLDACLGVRKDVTVIKTSIVFAHNKPKGNIQVSFRIRLKFKSIWRPEYTEIVDDVLTASIITLPDCCAVMLMHGGECKLFKEDLGYRYYFKVDGTHPWTIFTEMIFEYATLAGYGKVLATDKSDRCKNIATRLNVNTVTEFINPRTRNKISMYLKNIRDC